MPGLEETPESPGDDSMLLPVALRGVLPGGASPRAVLRPTLGDRLAVAGESLCELLCPDVGAPTWSDAAVRAPIGLAVGAGLAMALA